MNTFIIKDGPEIRTYSSPEYEDKLQNSLIVYLNEHNSIYLKEYQAKFKFMQLNLKNYEKKRKGTFFRFIEILFSGVKKRYKIFKGIQEYSHIARKQTVNKENKILSFLLYLPFYLLARVYDYLSLQKNLHINELEQYKDITTLYIAAYNKHYLSIILNMKEINPKLKVISILHSEKDLLVDSYIPNIIDEVHLWKESNFVYLKKTYPFFKNKIKLIGVPRFKALKMYIDAHEGESHKAINIMYICAHPYIVNDEFTIIEELIKLTRKLKKDFNWIIRLNPMNKEEKAFESLVSKDVSISYPKWEWSEKSFFNMPSLQAEEDFFSDIFRSDIFVGGISTVALEACINRKKYLAITFDNKGYNEKLSTLLESSIYDEYRRSKQILICKNKEEFRFELIQILEEKILNIPFDKLNSKLLAL